MLHLHPHKNWNNAAKATYLFKGLNAGYEAWKKGKRRAPLVLRVDLPISSSTPIFQVHLLWARRNGGAWHHTRDTKRNMEQ